MKTTLLRKVIRSAQIPKFIKWENPSRVIELLKRVGVRVSYIPGYRKLIIRGRLHDIVLSNSINVGLRYSSAPFIFRTYFAVNWLHRFKYRFFVHYPEGLKMVEEKVNFRGNKNGLKKVMVKGEMDGVAILAVIAIVLLVILMILINYIGFIQLSSTNTTNTNTTVTNSTIQNTNDSGNDLTSLKSLASSLAIVVFVLTIVIGFASMSAL